MPGQSSLHIIDAVGCLYCVVTLQAMVPHTNNPGVTLRWIEQALRSKWGSAGVRIDSAVLNHDMEITLAIMVFV